MWSSRMPPHALLRGIASRRLPATTISGSSSQASSVASCRNNTAGTSPIDTSSAATDAQAASDQEVQQIQQMNDESALNASMAAAEQQNDAANAATLQTEINAGF
jgi:hypothetical protein